ncbi:troponin I isoform X1 [Spodoptera frugiperda]|uniref:Troponin I n=1 Tax=Spodoptera frugiperda TaxID=7108 RepID=A0A9R0F3J6_SPOFR|nr:troponin I isoform X1 [Spodoptera frugiperda]
MADDEKKRLEEAKKAKQAEIDRKRAEVRKRMEEASKAKKAKKGFMTPERKKKLRLLLRKKAAEELKKEQERKAAERRRIIEERCGKPKNVEDANEDALVRVCKEYHTRIGQLEDEKFDLEYIVKRKDMEISDLNSQVNDLRGKFVKPTLKKVSKYENKFAKLQKKAAEFNFRNQLKVVKKKEFTLEEEDKEVINNTHIYVLLEDNLGNLDGEYKDKELIVLLDVIANIVDGFDNNNVVVKAVEADVTVEEETKTIATVILKRNNVFGEDMFEKYRNDLIIDTYK